MTPKPLTWLINLRVKRYGYIDPYNKKTQKTIGFIAQEVNDVLPNAVSIQKGFIPDEIREITNPVWNASSDGSWTLTISDILFQSNHTEKCRFYFGETKKDIQVETDRVSFKFDRKWDNVYLWGKEINDFHMIDKNQIFALHHSAIQELDRKHKREVESKQEIITGLESRIESLESFLLTISNKQQEIDTKQQVIDTKQQVIDTKQQEIIKKNDNIESRIQLIESNSISNTEKESEAINTSNIVLL